MDNDNKSIAENYEDQNTGRNDSGNNFKSLTNNKDSTKRPKSSYEDTHRKLLYKESNRNLEWQQGSVKLQSQKPQPEHWCLNAIRHP